MFSKIFGAGESLEVSAEGTGLPTQKPLGFIAQKYESGGAGPGTIADVPGDAGGKAYGIYQFDYRHGHLNRYVATSSKYKEVFSGCRPGTKEFDERWRKLAEEEPEKFARDQNWYAIKTFYEPAIKYAAGQGFIVQSRAVQEAIFSMAIQHGGWRRILKKVRRASDRKDPEQCVRQLYAHRLQYVLALNSISDRVKQALKTRYSLELQDVLALLNRVS